MHLALFQSPDTVPLALPAVDDRIKPYIPELNQFPGTFPTKLEIIEQSSANVMLLKKLLKELQGIFQAPRGHGWPKASHDHGLAEGQPWVAV